MNEPRQRVKRPNCQSSPVIGMLLAACAGSADVLAFFGLGSAFAGIVTGNLVTAGYGLAVSDTALVKPTVTAVVGCIVGEIAWARLLRRPGTGLALLISEIALFLLVLAGWLAAGSRPAGGSALILLAAVSVALGGQSIWALSVHQATTYFTGMLTTSINTALRRSSSALTIRTSVRQLAALLTGATLGGATLRFLRPAAPAIPLLLLVLAAAVHILSSPRHPPALAASTMERD